MRIVHVNKRYGFEGGVEQYLHWVSDELSKRGHEIWFIGADRGSEKAANFIAPERVILIRELVESPNDPNPLAAEKLASAIKSISPDIVYAHHLKNPHLVPAMRAHAPVVRFAHGEDVICPLVEKSFIRDWEPCLYKSGPLTCGVLCPFVHRHGSRHPRNIRERLRTRETLHGENSKIEQWVVASRYIEESLLREGYARESVNVIPYFTYLPEQIKPLPAGKPVILFAGRLVEAKGVDRLLEAFSLIRTDAVLKIAGDGPERPGLEALASELNISERTRFLGALPNQELQALWDEARVVAVPSLFQEPFGIVGIEAMAHARPVVAHDVGGISDWLAHGETGYLVKSKDVKALAERLDEMLIDAELARQFGLAGRERVKAKFLAEQHLDALERVFARAAT